MCMYNLSTNSNLFSAFKFASVECDLKRRAPYAKSEKLQEISW
jgi:hypothetical protein